MWRLNAPRSFPFLISKLTVIRHSIEFRFIAYVAGDFVPDPYFMYKVELSISVKSRRGIGIEHCGFEGQTGACAHVHRIIFLEIILALKFGGRSFLSFMFWNLRAQAGDVMEYVD